MNTCCPNCVGNDVAAICTETANVSIAGMSFSLPVMVTIAAGTAAVFFGWQAARRIWCAMPKVQVSRS